MSISSKHQAIDDIAGVLVQFYLGRATDNRGRTIDEIQSWDHQKLEYVHDYIQWLFPLTESSRFNPDAPTLDEQQIAAFRASDELRVRLLKSLNTMLSFYGLQCEDTREGSRITKADSFELKKGNWLTRSNHNYLRITRILMGLQLLSLQEYAGAFLRFLEQLYKENSDRIGETTLQYWKRAVVL